MKTAKVHSIREIRAHLSPAWVKTHCGMEGYKEQVKDEYGTTNGFIFEAVEVSGPDRRVTCKRCQRRRFR